MAQGTNQDENKPQGSDLTQGVALTDFVDGKLLGHVGDEEVLLVHSGGEIFAVGAHCAHYHGPLAEGLVTGESV
ncbi:MAG: Rieske 2Fe-2S domain-containing protein, partial [Xanthobacteraceae bacterium]